MKIRKRFSNRDMTVHLYEKEELSFGATWSFFNVGVKLKGGEGVTLSDPTVDYQGTLRLFNQLTGKKERV